jgi:hypothetical protein
VSPPKGVLKIIDKKMFGKNSGICIQKQFRNA